MAMKQYLRLTKESVYGSYDSGALTANILYIPLDRGNAFKVQPVPQKYVFRTADARNRAVGEVSSRKVLAGNLNILGYAGLVGPLLDWSSTITSDDLASFTADFFDSVRVRRILGCKIMRAEGTCAAETNEGALGLNLNIVAQKDTTDPVFAEPAISVFANYRSPYKHVETKTGLVAATSGSTARTKYRSFGFTIENKLVPAFDEDTYISDCTYNGRDVMWNFAVRFTSKADRDAFEARTLYSGSVVFTKATPAHTLTLGFQAANRVEDLDDDLPIDSNAYETIRFRSFLDTTAGTDFTSVET